MKFLSILLLSFIPFSFLFAQKEPIILRKIEATPAVIKSYPPSLESYLQALPAHFITHLNQTGKYAVVDLDEVINEANLEIGRAHVRTPVTS